MITETIALTRLLTHLGMPTSPPQIEPARLPPQTTWDFDELEGSAAVIAKPSARGPPDVQWLCLPSVR